jgi:hypothetical protein
MAEDIETGGPPLRVVTRVSGGAPAVVRMSELREGELFTIEDHGKKVFRACGAPYQQGRHTGPGVTDLAGPNVWAIVCEQA